jgi:hypothetical protein
MDLHRGLAFDSDEHASFQHHVITYHLHKVWQKRSAIRESDLGGDAPRRGEASLEKNAPREANRAKRV